MVLTNQIFMRYKRKNKNNVLLRKLITYLETNICTHKTIHKMKQTFVTTDFNVQAFSISQVIFDDSDLVSLQVNCRIREKLMSTTFLFTFSKFNDLLRFSGDNGEKLQLLVSDKLLSQSNERPHIIDLSNQPLVFSICQLDMCYLIDGDDTCFSIEEVSPLSYIQQAKNLRNNIRDFNTVQLENKTQLNQALIEMASMYRYYLGLKELNLNDASAREKAGLQNEKLYKMAFCASLVR
jgi:hypothetical protein